MNKISFATKKNLIEVSRKSGSLFQTGRVTGFHTTDKNWSIPGFQLPFFPNLPSKVAPTSVLDFATNSF